MKKIFGPLLALLLVGAGEVSAHEAHKHGGSKLFGAHPEYVHVLLNPLPSYGLSIGVATLLAALLLKNKTARSIALVVVIVSAALAWPVLKAGQSAYAGIREQSDDSGQRWLDEHMERAEKLVYVFYAAALLGVVALVSQRKFPKAATSLSVVTLFVGAASLAAGGWIAKAGGQIRHPEFRAESAPSTNSAPHEHGAHGVRARAWRKRRAQAWRNLRAVR